MQHQALSFDPRRRNEQEACLGDANRLLDICSRLTFRSANYGLAIEYQRDKTWGRGVADSPARDPISGPVVGTGIHITAKRCFP